METDYWCFSNEACYALGLNDKDSVSVISHRASNTFGDMSKCYFINIPVCFKESFEVAPASHVILIVNSGETKRSSEGPQFSTVQVFIG